VHCCPLDGPIDAGQGANSSEMSRAPQAARPAVRLTLRDTVETPAIDVLLLDAHYRQAVTCLRAYTRAGLRVGAVACESEASWAPATRSRWCAAHATVPDFAEHESAYVDALLALVKEWGPRLVVPAHDGSIEALRERRQELECLTALGLASEAALDVAVSKERTLALASDLGLVVPRGITVGEHDDVAAALREVGLPAVIKPVESWVVRNGTGTRLSTLAVGSVDEARIVLEHVFTAGGTALVQEWLPGRREAVTLFYADGRFWARMAQASHRDWPVLGGVSVLCETIPLEADITDSAERLVQAIDLEGCSMVEFRRDRHGRPGLMEINPRMGGSVALAVAAGVNFPMLLLQWKLGQPLEPVTSYRAGQRLRWLPGDIRHLTSVFDSQGQPDVPGRARATIRFVSDFARASTKVDVFDRSDLRPGLSELNRIVWHHAKRRARRSRPVQRLAALAQMD
jgi:predicted ATP-grasp superfamily ATP-dependent carboligase